MTRDYLFQGRRRRTPLTTHPSFLPFAFQETAAAAAAQIIELQMSLLKDICSLLVAAAVAAPSAFSGNRNHGGKVLCKVELFVKIGNM